MGNVYIRNAKVALRVPFGRVLFYTRYGLSSNDREPTMVSF
jgi:hypothetical protein